MELVKKFLDAVAARDIDAVLTHFSPDATWQNVPHPAAVGHAGIAAMLGPILARSTEVRWDIISASYDDNRVWLERIDRFWINDAEYAVRCNGVLEIDAVAGVITELRDYVDVGEWRVRLAGSGLVNG